MDGLDMATEGTHTGRGGFASVEVSLVCGRGMGSRRRK